MKIIKMMAVAVLGVVMTACSSKKEEKTVEPITVTTEVAAASSDYLDKTYVGTIEAKATTAVSFVGSGTMAKLYVSEGQRVGKGQLLAELDATQNNNMLAAAKASMAQANDALARMKQLHDAGSLPDMKWIEVQSQVAQAESQLRIAEKALADCKLIAPVSGVVGSVMFQAGSTVLTSEPVLTLVDISSVKVRVSIPEREIASVSAHTRSFIHVDALGRSYEGGSIEKGISADAMTHTYDIKINVPNGDGKLLPGMIANVKMATNSVNANGTTVTSVRSAITVPIRCIQQAADGQRFVWLNNGGKAHRQDITIGDTYGNRVIIAEGLKGGESVIVEGYQKVGEGTEIKN